ncbi:hypothetical protein CPB85DRAFT_1313466 [Mucidula mucida]|nr:hypothetical protein CPB85DRAFT_1313466 [Mucidula mucida]
MMVEWIQGSPPLSVRRTVPRNVSTPYCFRNSPHNGVSIPRTEYRGRAAVIAPLR